MLALPVVTNDFLAINYKMYFMFEKEFYHVICISLFGQFSIPYSHTSLFHCYLYKYERNKICCYL